MAYIAPYLVLINLLGFALMGMDKSKARRGKRRIPEKSLFAAALLGGAFGAWLGLAAFRHKTRHFRFKFGLPVIFLLQAALLLYFLPR